MNPDPPSAEPPPIEPPTPGINNPPPFIGVREVLWLLLAASAVLPALWLGGAISASVALSFIPAVQEHEDAIIIGVATVLALALAWPLFRLGLRRGWARRKSLLIGWGLAAAASLTLTVALVLGFIAVRDSSKYKAMIPRQLTAAADQFWLENGAFKVFIRYDDLVGSNRYIKANYSADGEDPGAQFPIRYGWNMAWKVRLPDGTTVERAEVFASVGRSGIVATYPNPHEGSYDPDRVYQLPDGTTFRRNRVVNRPPDPAGMEGRDQDGVHVYALEGGVRYEITFRGGLADGPFRAYRADGRLWVEASYVRGRVTGPAWHYLPDGSKFDELAVNLEEALRLTQPPAPVPPTPAPRPPPSAVTPPARKSPPANPDYAAGLRKFRAQDYTGAAEDFGRALAANPRHAASWHGRADARRRLGDLNGAIADYTAAIERSPSASAAATSFYERAHLHRITGDVAAAATDFRLVTSVPAARLWLYVTECERGQREAAVLELSAALSPATGSALLRGFHAEIGGFLLGRVDAAQLEARIAAASPAVQPGQRFLAAFYAAMRSRLDGDDAAAREGFNQALLRRPATPSYEYEIAEIRRAVPAADSAATPGDPGL
ncbi:MAG: tetratricopeptide repeat protein [Opitutaceae bacterium]|nr:tetratricopeptide repeat protein [Opitutaceae bacterium]